MAKKKTKKSQGPTIVKNGKRVPASTRGKAKKPAPAKKPADDKAKRNAAIARQVWKQTEAHRSTIGKLAALVDTWDEYDVKAEALKDECGGLKGQISEDRAEIRRIVREDGDNAEANRLKSLERDIEKREVKLAGKQEERSGAREAMKCAMGDIRKIIRDGPGLFEKPEDAKEGGDTPAGKADSPTSASASEDGPKPSRKPPAPPTSNGTTRAPSRSTDAPKTPTAPSPAAGDKTPSMRATLKGIGVRDVLGEEFSIASEALEERNINNLDDVAQRGMTEVRRIIAPAQAAMLLERIKQVRAEMPTTVAV